MLQSPALALVESSNGDWKTVNSKQVIKPKKLLPVTRVNRLSLSDCIQEKSSNNNNSIQFFIIYVPSQ
jgi:hypothetical protein